MDVPPDATSPTDESETEVGAGSRAANQPDVDPTPGPDPTTPLDPLASHGDLDGGAVATSPVAAPPQSDAERAALRRIWNRSLPVLQEAIANRQQMETAPARSLFGEDQASLQEDFNDLLDDLMDLVVERPLSETQEEITEIQERIRERRADIAGYREARAGAPVEHLIQTTQSGYDQKIARAEADIRQLEARLQEIRSRFAHNLASYGVVLTPEQIEVLLTRVDADDIVRMTVVFDSVKSLTSRLKALTQESGEDLRFARKYYGMHVVLLELIIHAQNRYFQQVEDKYLPALDKVLRQTRLINEEARREMGRESSAARRRIYQANIEAHELTLRAGELYSGALRDQMAKVRQAQARVRRDLVLARNTLKTVMVSADLLALLDDSQQTFNAVFNLQAPELVPFQNIELRNKFIELSDRISQ